jgi:hypothetical protein
MIYKIFMKIYKSYEKVIKVVIYKIFMKIYKTYD